MVTMFGAKPKSFVSNDINCGVYLLSPKLFDDMKEVYLRHLDDPVNDSQAISLENDIIVPLVSKRTSVGKVGVYGLLCWLSSVGSLLKISLTYPFLHRLWGVFACSDQQWAHFHVSVKFLLEPDQDSCVRSHLVYQCLHRAQASFRFAFNSPGGACRSTIYANRHYLAAMRQHTPALLADDATFAVVGDVRVDITAEIDPTAKLGPNVSVGPHVRVGPGARIKDAIILGNVTIGVSELFLCGQVRQPLLPPPFFFCHFLIFSFIKLS